MPGFYLPIENEAVIELIVVDNASSDGSPDLVHERFSQVRLIQNPTNVGFARAKQPRHPPKSRKIYIVIKLDTLVRPGALNIC